MGSTWIKYYEKINYWEHRQDLPVFSVFMYLVSQAVYEPKQKKGLFLHPGQCTVTYTEVCRYAGVSDAQLRRAVKLLVESETIKWEGRDRFSLVTIVNWEEYQSLPAKSNVITNGQTTQIPTDKQREKQRTNNEKTNDSYRRIDEQTNRRTDEQTLPKEREAPNPEVLPNFDKSDFGKPEASAVNTQAEPEGQKKKGAAQKRKGTGLSPEDWAALAFPTMMRNDDDMELAFDFARTKPASKRTEISAKRQRNVLNGASIQDLRHSIAYATAGTYQAVHLKTAPGSGQPGQKPGQSGQKPAYQTAQVNFKKEADLIDMIKFSDDNAAQRTYNLEMRAKLYLVRKGKDSQDPNLLKSVKEAHETGKLNLDALDLNPTNANE